jgi:hypothetical protein
MTLIEWIGFIISLFGLVFLFSRDTMTARQKRKNPELYAEREKKLKQTLRELGITTDDEDEEEQEIVIEAAPPPPQTLVFEAPVKVLPKKIAENPLSPLARMVKGLPDKRFLLVSSLIFGKPKSLE